MLKGYKAIITWGCSVCGGSGESTRTQTWCVVAMAWSTQNHALQQTWMIRKIRTPDCTLSAIIWLGYINGNQDTVGTDRKLTGNSGVMWWFCFDTQNDWVWPPWLIMKAEPTDSLGNRGFHSQLHSWPHQQPASMRSGGLAGVSCESSMGALTHLRYSWTTP